MITKDGRDTPIEKLTPDNYIVPKGEERSYHAVIEVVQYDPKTGRKLSKPSVQKFGKKQFEANVLNSLRKQGYIVTILHDPNAWIKEQQELAAKTKAEREAAKAKAEKEKFDAAVAEAVAKELAKQKKAEKEAAAKDAEKAAKDAKKAAKAAEKEAAAKKSKADENPATE